MVRKDGFASLLNLMSSNWNIVTDRILTKLKKHVNLVSIVLKVSKLIATLNA